MTGGHERCRGPWTATCQTLVDFVAKHAGILEPLHDHGQVLAGVVSVVEALTGLVRVEYRDANHAGLLFLCGARRSNHSITSSARCRSNGGTSSPSVLAVLRLMISSNLTGAWTGSSLGFAPLRMRSTYVGARRKLSIRSSP